MTFTTTNVLRAVQEVEDTDRLGYCLGVTVSKRAEIQSQFSSVAQQREAIIHFFIDNYSLASWRSVICALDWMGKRVAADDVRHLSEPVTGKSSSCHVRTATGPA